MTADPATMTPTRYREQAPGSSRHSWNDTFTTTVQSVLWGRAADALRAEQARVSTPHAVVALPQWGWAVARMSVGRKDMPTDGSTGRLLLPVRLSWTEGSVALIAGGASTTLSVVGAGVGHKFSAQVKVSGDGQGLLSVLSSRLSTTRWEPAFSLTDSSLRLPEAVTAPSYAPRCATSILDRLSREGREAWWSLIEHAERMVSDDVSRKHTKVSLDVSGGTETMILDQIALDTVRDRLVLGDQGSGRGSRVTRMLERCLEPLTFLRVDPMRYVQTTLARDAYDLVRAQAGEPQVGTRVRQIVADLAEQGEDADLDAITAEFRRRHPSSKLTRAQVVASLTRPEPVDLNAFSFEECRETPTEVRW